MKKEEIIQKIKNAKSSNIKFAVTDIDGILRGKYIHKKKFLDSVDKGLGFCDVIFGWDSGDVCYDNTKITGWHTGYPDGKAQIDLSTYREIPWEESQSFFLADFSDAQEKYRNVCPRNLLKRIHYESVNLGFIPLAGLEYEWFNFAGTPSEIAASGFSKLEPISPGMFGYSVLRSTLNNSYFHDIFKLLEKFGVPIEGLHTETGPGVLEASIIYDSILNAADNAVLFKTGVKEIAYKHDILATFMAKWNSKLPGCGGHIHQSLWNEDQTVNLFFDKRNALGMSKVMEHFIAGQLACLPQILPMYAPTVNSYKRIGQGDWAPSNVTWGIDNRTTAVRAIPGNEKSTRIEMRVPGADANPYLALAAGLASGIYGIKNELPLEIEPCEGSGYESAKNALLPKDLKEATKIMANSKIAKELFGEYFVDHFTKTREWEWEKYSKEVSNWELSRYIEII